MSAEQLDITCTSDRPSNAIVGLCYATIPSVVLWILIIGAIWAVVS